MKQKPLVWFDENNSGAAAGSGPSEAGAPAAEGASAPASSGPPSEGASPPEGAEATPSPSHDPFDGMDSADFYDSVDLGPQAAGTGDEPGPVPAPHVAGAEGVPTPAAQAPQSVQPQAAVPPTAPATPPENVQGTPVRSQLEQAMEGFKGAANQTALADWASRELFKLSEEEAVALESDSVNLIPKLMGKVYTQAMQSAVNLIKNLVPEMVNSGITTQQTRAQRATEALSEFYQANPHLSADQHGSAVDKWARSFRAANPQASRADAIAFVGKAVSAEFGIWPSQNGSGQSAARRPAPFAPARQGGRAPTQAKGPHDPYAGMEEEYD